jgi:hypothetical protein
MSLEIPIRAELNGLQGDLSKAVSVVSDASEKFAQAADKASKRAAGGVDAILASGNSLKQQYRALSREAVDLADKYGAMDARAIKAAQAAGEIKDKIEDTNVVINAFKADSKFTVVAGALQQAAGAASIVTGAMGLLGVKSEEAQQTMLKVQSALALTQGLASLKEMGASFTALSAVIQTSVIPSLMTLNGALMATGIGVVVAGVVALTMAASSYNDEIQKTIEKEKELAETRKLDREAFVKAGSEILKDVAIYNKTIKDKTQREIANIKLTRDQAIQAEKERFENSNKTWADENRLTTNINNIKKAYEVQLTEFKNQENEKRLNKLKEAKDKAEKLADEERKTLFKYRRMYWDSIEKYEDKVAVERQKNIDKELDSYSTMADELNMALPEGIIMPINLVLQKASVLAAKENLVKATEDFKNTVVNAFINMGMQAAYALGQALTSSADFGDSLKTMLAQLMSTIAGALIILGGAIFAVDPVRGTAMIAGAIALQIAAGALAGSAGGGGGGSTPAMSPTASGGNGFGGGGIGSNANFNNFNMRTEGKDLILAVQRQGNYNRRG